MPENSHSAVFELGMSKPGEIADLTRHVLPQIAIITSIAPAHLEFFDSLDSITQAKAEIFLGMTDNGTAILDHDTPFFSLLKTQAQSLKTILTFGTQSDSDAGLLSHTIDLQNQRTLIKARIFETVLSYEIGCLGRHHAMNSLAVLLAVQAIGGDLTQALHDLAFYQALPGRGKIHLLSLKSGGSFTLIDDTYNANPASMTAAIELLGAISPTAPYGRRLIALGPMKELGVHSHRFHHDLIDVLGQARIDRVFCCGASIKPLYDALESQKQGAFCTKSAKLAPLIWGQINPGDVILIKGSRESRMEKVLEFFLGGPG